MLGEVLGDVLTPAIGIALSPVPIIAVILMLLSPRAAATASAFALGWLGGILLVALLVVLFVPASAASAGGGGSVVGWVKLALGAVILGLSANQWRQRPKPGVEPKLPKWMAGIDRTGPVTALGLGLALSTLNPKNLPLALAAGLSLAQVNGGPQAAGLIVFGALAASSVVVPVLAYLLFRGSLDDTLASLKDWLAHNNATVMFVVLLIMGAMLVAKGLGTLFSLPQIRKTECGTSGIDSLDYPFGGHGEVCTMSSRESKQAWAMGGTIFAATTILVIGCFQVIMGISALAQDEIFVSGANYTYDIDITGWGWIHLILGVVMMFTGIFLYGGFAWARNVGIVLAVFSAVDNFFFIPYYPLWSIVVIAVDIFAIWSLATVSGYGLPPKPAAEAANRTQTQDWSHVNEPTTPRTTDRPDATQEHTAER